MDRGVTNEGGGRAWETEEVRGKQWKEGRSKKLEDGRAGNNGSGRGESCERSSMTCRRSEGY